MIILDGKKVTANEMAKFYVYCSGEAAHTTFADSLHYTPDAKKLTEREVKQVQDAISKQIDRLHKFLGIRKIEMKK